MVRQRWSFKFTIQCRDRRFYLFAASEDERTLWIYALAWIIKENIRIKDRKELHAQTQQMFK